MESDATTAKIEVASTPQQAALLIGESKKFEVTDDRVYDLAVTVRNINGSKVNITVNSISELMPENETSRSGSATGGLTSGTNTTNQTGFGGKNGASAGRIAPYLWGLMIILLIALGATFYYLYWRK